MSPRPVVDQTTEELYAALEPGGFAFEDEALDWPLLKFCQALVGEMFEDVAALVRDDDQEIARASLAGPEHPGWSVILDLDRCPAAFLPWLAQFVGVRIDEGMSEADSRERIRSTDGFQRGSLTALEGAPLQHLTGTKFVQLRERFDPSDPAADSPYHLYVATKPGETPDPDKVEAALIAQKPAGIVLHYRVTESNTDYEAIDVYHADYAALLVAYATYDAMFTAGHTYRDATQEVLTYGAGTGTYGDPMGGM